jgi:thiamine pyrophosphokinase
MSIMDGVDGMKNANGMDNVGGTNSGGGMGGMNSGGGLVPETRRCVIFAGYVAPGPAEAFAAQDGDFVICADSGYEKAVAAGVRPDLVIGDFDSLAEAPAPGIPVITASPEKDDTDTGLALKYGLDAGYKDFLIIGGIGGRLDHTLANLQLMSYCLDRGGRPCMRDAWNTAFMTDSSAFTLEPRGGAYFSVLSWSPCCTGLCIENAKYTVEGYTLRNSFPIGVSNEFIGGPAIIRKDSGRLLIIVSFDPPK